MIQLHYISGKLLKVLLLFQKLVQIKHGLVLLYLFFYYFFFNFYFFFNIFISMIISILLFFGDIFFSYIKRFLNIKDFSNCLGSHGGVLID